MFSPAQSNLGNALKTGKRMPGADRLVAFGSCLNDRSGAKSQSLQHRVRLEPIRLFDRMTDRRSLLASTMSPILRWSVRQLHIHTKVLRLMRAGSLRSKSLLSVPRVFRPCRPACWSRNIFSASIFSSTPNSKSIKKHSVTSRVHELVSADTANLCNELLGPLVVFHSLARYSYRR